MRRDPGLSPDYHERVPRSYVVHTLGCQMNVHDSERMAGLLEDAGYAPVAEGDEPDVVVINTCAVRENADNRLYGNLGQLAPRKRANPAMRIAVTGCLAQKDRDLITTKAPWVDVVLGTHNIGSLPTLLERASRTALPQVYDPRHPMANAEGYYAGSGVNLVVELADAREASRSYEANLQTFKQAREMVTMTIDLLRSR